MQWKYELGLTASLESPKLSPIKLICSACGKTFALSVAEEKIFARRNLQPPKRRERSRIPG